MSNSESYFYDKAGNVTNFVDRRGVSVSFWYDTLDRRTGIVYAADDSVGYFYDAVGRVTNVTARSVNNSFTYDSLDRLTQEHNSYAQAAATINYGYNDAGLRTNMVLASETPVQYFYDAANRLTNVVQGTLTASLTYDDAGRRTKLVLPYGINVLYSYDAASRLTNITYQGAVTNKIDYAYDAVGSRVAQASLPVGFANYNLPSAVANSQYDDANRQLVFGSYQMLYDANGNVTNLVFNDSNPYTNSLSWSARNQLTNRLGAVTASFIYDGLGRRVSRTVNGVAQQYTYDGLDTIMEHRAMVLKFLYFRGLGIDEPWHQARIRVSNPISTNNVVYMADALGSIVAMTDSNQNVITEYDYEPFGATTTMGNGLTNSYKFTAREEDGTGLYYYRARYYNPALGRFVSEDPLRFDAGDANFYSYVHSNPLNLTDFMGLLSCAELVGHLRDIEAKVNAQPHTGVYGAGSPYRTYYEYMFEGGRPSLIGGPGIGMPADE